jgi:hypothetical protein
MNSDGLENRGELERMVVFGLKESAQRIAALAEEVRTEPLRTRLFGLVRQLEREASTIQESAGVLSEKAPPAKFRP